jgi:hypothetical protein
MRTDIPPQDILNLFLLEFSFDDQSPTTIHTSSGAHFNEQERDHMCWFTMHSPAYVANVCEHGFLVSIPVDGRWSERISLT